MEMESAQSNDSGNCVKGTPHKQLFYTGTPDISNDFEDQQVSPRVGDEYQVEIPSMLEPEQPKLLTNSSDSIVVDVSLKFQVGLPIIPIVWSGEECKIEDNGQKSPTNPDDVDNAKGSQESKNSKNGGTRPKKNSLELKVEPLEFVFDQREESRAENLVEEDSNHCLRSTSCYPVPGSSSSSWSDAEVDGFLLGLYIFGKNFYQVKSFIEHKDMGEVLSFYYGKFYRSDAHRRWSECRKSRKRKCIIGEKIFTGWRQRELLSRMIPHVPEEFQNSLSEGYKSFAEGKTSLEEYVSFLKSTVGIHVLVKAIGIGKEKEDLTGFASEPEKNNQENPVCPKLATAKASSSLTFSEIMKCLTGGSRLSKARCNDIFWEAVWPRLLENGWHSEQPKNHGYVSLKNSLVFLMPGVKKFSRRKLVRGDKYFDSVSDVLNKVTFEPKLLQLEAEGDLVGSWNEEGGWVPEVTSDQEDLSRNQRHCYLKPRVAASKPDRLKFTIVDTSLVHGGKSRGIVEKRYLPDELEISSKQTSCSTEDEEDALEDKLNDYGNDTDEMSMNSETNIAKHLKRKRFTVVDTSLVYGGKSSKVRQMRCSPAVGKSSSKSTGLLQETEGNCSRDDATEVSLDTEVDGFSANCHNDTSDIGGTNQMTTINKSDSAENIESHLDHKTSKSDDKQSKRTLLHQFRRRPKNRHSNSKGPIVKLRRLSACANVEKSCVKKVSPDLKSEQVGPRGTLNSVDAGDLVGSQVSPHEKKSSLASLSEGSRVMESSLETSSGNHSGGNMSEGEKEKHQSQESPSPNLHLDSVDSINCENFVVDLDVSRETNGDGPCLPSSGTKHADDALSNSNMNSRRQSTRNRPLTARALEALADGFLAIKPRRKRKEVCIKEKPLSSSLRRAPKRIKATLNHTGTNSGVVASKGDVDVVEAFTVDKDMVSTDTINGVLASKKEIDVNEAFKVNRNRSSKPLDQIGEKWLTSY